MKVLILIIAVIALLALPCSARMGVGMMASGSGASSGTETIGTTSVGASTWEAAADRLISSVVATATKTGTFSKIYVYMSCDTAADDIDVGIYKGATFATATFVGKKAFADIGTFSAQWKEFDVSDQSWASEATSYWLVVHTSASNDITFYYDVVGTDTMHYSGVAYGSAWPDPAGNWSDANRGISIKADITY